MSRLTANSGDVVERCFMHAFRMNPDGGINRCVPLRQGNYSPVAADIHPRRHHTREHRAIARRGTAARLTPHSQVAIHRTDGSTQHVPLLLRIDTPIEVDYYRAGGILPFVLRQLLAA